MPIIPENLDTPDKGENLATKLQIITHIEAFSLGGRTFALLWLKNIPSKMLKPLQKWIKVGNRNSFSGSTQKENHDPDLLQ